MQHPHFILIDMMPRLSASLNSRQLLIVAALVARTVVVLAMVMVLVRMLVRLQMDLLLLLLWSRKTIHTDTTFVAARVPDGRVVRVLERELRVRRVQCQCWWLGQGVSLAGHWSHVLHQLGASAVDGFHEVGDAGS